MISRMRSTDDYRTNAKKQGPPGHFATCHLPERITNSELGELGGAVMPLQQSRHMRVPTVTMSTVSLNPPLLFAVR